MPSNQTDAPGVTQAPAHAASETSSEETFRHMDALTRNKANLTTIPLELQRMIIEQVLGDFVWTTIKEQPTQWSSSYACPKNLLVCKAFAAMVSQELCKKEYYLSLAKVDWMHDMTQSLRTLGPVMINILRKIAVHVPLSTYLEWHEMFPALISTLKQLSSSAYENAGNLSVTRVRSGITRHKIIHEGPSGFGGCSYQSGVTFASFFSVQPVQDAVPILEIRVMTDLIFTAAGLARIQRGKRNLWRVCREEHAKDTISDVLRLSMSGTEVRDDFFASEFYWDHSLSRWDMHCCHIVHDEACLGSEDERADALDHTMDEESDNEVIDIEEAEDDPMFIDLLAGCYQYSDDSSPEENDGAESEDEEREDEEKNNDEVPNEGY